MAARKAVAVRFGPEGGRTYDYWCALPVVAGQRVVVPTKRGTATVVVVEVRDSSDMAKAEVISLAPDDEAAQQ